MSSGIQSKLSIVHKAHPFIQLRITKIIRYKHTPTNPINIRMCTLPRKVLNTRIKRRTNTRPVNTHRRIRRAHRRRCRFPSEQIHHQSRHKRWTGGRKTSLVVTRIEIMIRIMMIHVWSVMISMDNMQQKELAYVTRYCLL